MGTCKYCGQKAGLFSSFHNACKEANQRGKSIIIDKIVDTISGSNSYKNLDLQIKEIAQNSFIQDNELIEIQSIGFDQSVNKFIDNGILSIENENRLNAYQDYYKFDTSLFDKNNSIQKIVKATILRDVINGEIPRAKININGSLPFLLQKSESLIWIFQEVQCFEKKTKTVYEGRSSGVSFRVAKGVYIRSGSFKGNPVKTEETVLVGNGMVALTNCNLYFASANKVFKIPYHKILSIIPYEDGIGLQKDGASARPQILKGLDGWFAYNLISNLTKI